MISYRRPPSSYCLRESAIPARLERAGRIAARWLARSAPAVVRVAWRALCVAWRGRFGLALVVIFAIVAWMPVRDAERELALQAAHTRVADAEIRMTALANWHRDQTVKVTLEGDAGTVRNFAGQIAAIVR